MPWNLNEQKQFYDSFHTGNETFKLMEHDTVLTSGAGPQHRFYHTATYGEKHICKYNKGKKGFKILYIEEKESAAAGKFCLL